MLAGPSEVLVIADSTANVETVAADLLAQVKHRDEIKTKMRYCHAQNLLRKWRTCCQKIFVPFIFFSPGERRSQARVSGGRIVVRRRLANDPPASSPSGGPKCFLSSLRVSWSLVFAAPSGPCFLGVLTSFQRNSPPLVLLFPRSSSDTRDSYIGWWCVSRRCVCGGRTYFLLTLVV